ncbi:MAG: papain-like cysteine peptidase, partial [Spirochaetaceae bacterium]|nr:papain-like cysteine peptidase [Spirochaetaceae bacterium]
MKIHPKKIIKAILPYGIIVLHKKYNEYRKLYKKTAVNEKNVFDIILSVGVACRATHYLKKHGLRLCANPLDWMMSYSLETVVHLYKTKFDDFFIDFVKDKEKSLEHNCHWYIDRKNKIVSMHYDNVENDSAMFRKMMKNRFEKINKLLLSANKICFISHRNDDINVLKDFLNEMGKLYSGKITYINIRNTPPPP